MDAVAVGQQLGFSPDRSMTYATDADGVGSAWAATTSYVSRRNAAPAAVAVAGFSDAERQAARGRRWRLRAFLEVVAEHAGVAHDAHDPLVPVHPQFQEPLDRRLGFPRGVREDDQCLVVATDVIGGARSFQFQATMRFQHHRADQMGNQLANEFGATPALDRDIELVKEGTRRIAGTARARAERLRRPRHGLVAAPRRAARWR